MLAVSVIATFCIILSMFCFLTQFFTVDTGDDDERDENGEKPFRPTYVIFKAMN